MGKTSRIIASILLSAAALTGIFAISSAVNGASSGQGAISAEAQYAVAQDSMLYIRCFYASGGLKTTGSGFVISSDGLALTAAHVIDKAASVTAIAPGGTETECGIISCDMDSDVAVLKLPPGKYKALELSDTDPPAGAVLRAMGYPIKDTLIITEGLLSSPCGTVNDKERMLVTCDIVNGMSGGPVLNQYGKVVGLCSGSVRTMNGIHLSAKRSDISEALTAAEGVK